MTVRRLDSYQINAMQEKETENLPAASGETAEQEERRTDNNARRRRGESLALTERYGMDKVLERVSQGDSVIAIARDVGIPARTLYNHLESLDIAADYKRARDLSAETWAERGWQCLQLPEDKIDPARVQLAWRKESHCMKRAGIANARYADKANVEVSGPNGGPIQQAVVHVYLPDNGRDAKLIEGETSE